VIAGDNVLECECVCVCLNFRVTTEICHTYVRSGEGGDGVGGNRTSEPQNG
jgi:hypothetical protein